MRSLLFAGLLILPVTCSAQPDPWRPDFPKATAPKPNIELKLALSPGDTYILYANDAPVKQILETVCAANGGRLLDSEKITISPSVRELHLAGTCYQLVSQVAAAGGLVVVPEGPDYRVLSIGKIPDSAAPRTPEQPEPGRNGLGRLKPYAPGGEGFKNAPQPRGPLQLVKG